MKDSSIIVARIILQTPHFYVLAVRTNDTGNNFDDYFFNTFRILPYRYNNTTVYTDTCLHFTVSTPVVPHIDEKYRNTLEKMLRPSQSYGYLYNNSSNDSYWNPGKYAWFRNDSTGELIGTLIMQYPKYFYKTDMADFWRIDNLKNYFKKKSMVLYSLDSIRLSDGTPAWQYTIRDTGSSGVINHLAFLKDHYFFNISTLSDTLSKQSDFVTSFFKTFTPKFNSPGENIFNPAVIDSFFFDLASKDSATHALAKKAISNIDFSEKDIPKITNAINNLNPGEKDYYEIKSALISELGYIHDTTNPVVVPILKKIYETSGDTSTFQNIALFALSKHQTQEAVLTLKQLLIQDPPVFDESNDYSTLFENMQDSLALAAQLFPEILQLTELDDFKDPVHSLLVTLADSNYIKTSQYENYLSKILFDAKIELKKEQAKEQKEKEDKIANGNDNGGNDYNYRNNSYNSDSNPLADYALLLAPFYDSNQAIPKLFGKFLKLDDKDLQLSMVTILLRFHKNASDSLLLSLASDDAYRSKLYSNLEAIKRLDQFSSKYKTQVDIARSNLVIFGNYSNLDSVEYLSKLLVTIKEKKGYMYFFKYRVNKEGDWKIGLAGLQPEKEDSINNDNRYSVMTDKKIKTDKPLDEQLKNQLKRLIFMTHASSQLFFETDSNMYRFKKIAEYDDNSR
jgi:hypothetical protein